MESRNGDRLCVRNVEIWCEPAGIDFGIWALNWRWNWK